MGLRAENCGKVWKSAEKNKKMKTPLPGNRNAGFPRRRSFSTGGSRQRARQNSSLPHQCGRKKSAVRPSGGQPTEKDGNKARKMLKGGVTLM
jgi:hypothetical protein